MSFICASREGCGGRRRRALLQAVATKSSPSELRPESIKIDTHGNRAIVMCVITEGGKNYHNIRLFVRRDAKWKLLAWANEQVE
jgi:hypothetical protein